MGKIKAKQDKKTGKMVSLRDGLTTTQRWALPGILGFSHWYNDVKPRILHADGKYKRLRLTPEQGEYLKQCLKVRPDGTFQHNLSLHIEPRRMGKTILHVLILLYFHTAKKNWTTQLAGNSEHHSRRVQWKLLLDIIRQTPKLRSLIPERCITQHVISHPRKGNNILAMRGVSVRSAFGDSLNCIHFVDSHACADWSYFNALQASTISNENSLVLIDSNVDGKGEPTHKLQLTAMEDDRMYVLHRFFKDWQEYEKKAPPWINRAKAKRLMDTLLPQEASRDVLGLRGDSKNQLFSSHIILCCKSDYSLPVTDLQSLTKGRAYKIGAGLDRSKAIFGSLQGADNTVFTVVLKVAAESGEPEIYLLEQHTVIPNTAKHIKQLILRANEKWHLDNIVLESFEIVDLAAYLDDQKIPYEILSPHEKNQTISFSEFFRVAKENRLHFPHEQRDLIKEMRNFTYTMKGEGKFSFGSGNQKIHDDLVYSLNWAIFSLRAHVLQLFTIGNIKCNSKSSHREHCYLLGGRFILPGCSQECVAHHELTAMYEKFLQFQTESAVTQQQFFKDKVKHVGSKIYQAA